LIQAQHYVALDNADKTRDAETIANAMLSCTQYLSPPTNTSPNRLPKRVGNRVGKQVGKQVGTAALVRLLETLESVTLPRVLEDSIHHGSISHALSEHKQQQQDRKGPERVVQMFDSHAIACEEDVDHVLLHKSTSATLQQCERIHRYTPHCSVFSHCSFDIVLCITFCFLFFFFICFVFLCFVFLLLLTAATAPTHRWWLLFV
jgi:hypothetical protein